MRRKPPTPFSAHLLMAALTCVMAGLALVGDSPSEPPAFSEEDDWEFAEQEVAEAEAPPGADAEAEDIGKDEPPAVPATPAAPAAPVVPGVPPPGSPVLEGQKRVAGLDRFVGEEFSFEFGWRGPGAVVRVVAARGRARVVRRTSGGREQFVIQGSGRTRGVVRRLWSMDASIESVIDGPTGLVLRQSLEQEERRRHSQQTITFSEDGRTAERLRYRLHREPGESGYERLDSHESAVRLDAAALAFYLRNPAFRGNQRIDGALFDGKYTYGVHLQQRRRERIRVQGGRFNAIRYRAWFSDVDRPEEERGEDRVRRATLWVSDDQWRVPLLFESDTFVGQVFGELVSWIPPKAAKRR